MSPKITSAEKLTELRTKLEGVVLIGGVFDILHKGHIEHIREAKSAGKTLIVHITSDKRVKEKKGPLRPIQNEADRAEIVAAMADVDYVFISDVPHYDPKTLEIIKPDIVFLNYEAVSDSIKKYLKTIQHTTKVMVSDTIKKSSTTGILEKIKLAMSN